ncbi:MFS transporter [Nocardia brasiliensis]|uniref:MFS transporter n=1 Tax=Nocardia brasiliensis TaxID=37326 RepID=UPI002458C363|nr:MFS transporter [Nocardia brasiliensis]
MNPRRQPVPATRTPTPSSRAWIGLTVLATAQFLVVLTTSIVNIALPDIGRGLDLSPVGLSWVVNGYVLVFGALLILGGRIGDVFGRRRVFLTGTAIFTVTSIAAGLAPTAAFLLAARVGQGVGAALLAPTALALVLTLFPAGAGRARAIGVWGAVSGIGGVAGVLSGGLLSGVFGWRAVFLIGAPVAIAVLAATIWQVPADLPAGGRIDLWGAAFVTGGLAALTYALSVGGQYGWTAPRVVVPLIAAVLLLVLFAGSQRRLSQPLVAPAVLRIGGVLAANIVMTLLGAVWLGLFFFLPLYQQKVLGYTPIQAGLTQLPLAIMITAASTITPKLTRYLNTRTLLTTALALLAAGLAWLARTPVDGRFLIDIAAPSLLIGTGQGVAFVLLTARATTGVPAEHTGLAGGLINTTRQIGGALGLAGLLAITTASGDSGQPTAAQLAHAYGTAFAATAAIAAAAALLTAVLHDRPAA